MAPKRCARKESKRSVSNGVDRKSKSGHNRPTHESLARQPRNSPPGLAMPTRVRRAWAERAGSEPSELQPMDVCSEALGALRLGPRLPSSLATPFVVFSGALLIHGGRGKRGRGGRGEVLMRGGACGGQGHHIVGAVLVEPRKVLVVLDGQVRGEQRLRPKLIPDQIIGGARAVRGRAMREGLGCGAARPAARPAAVPRGRGARHARETLVAAAGLADAWPGGRLDEPDRDVLAARGTPARAGQRRGARARHAGSGGSHRTARQPRRCSRPALTKSCGLANAGTIPYLGHPAGAACWLRCSRRPAPHSSTSTPRPRSSCATSTPPSHASALCTPGSLPPYPALRVGRRRAREALSL